MTVNASLVLVALRTAGVDVTDLTIGDEGDRATWIVDPPTLQSAAQPVIDAFTPDDAALVRTAADQEVDSDDRLSDLLEALVANWGTIGNLTATGKAPQAVAHVKSAWRAKRRARKGV